MAELFRRTAVDKHIMEEHLDEPVTIVSPMFWIAAAAGGLLTVLVILWAVFARIPLSVTAQGIAVLNENGKFEIICYVPLEEGKQIEEGMKVVFQPLSESGSSNHTEGIVSEIEPYVTSQEQAEFTLGDKSLAEYFCKDGPVMEVKCDLTEDKTAGSTADASSEGEEPTNLKNGTMFEAGIITGYKAPITFVFHR